MKTRNEITTFLECLVHSRFSEKSINEKLSTFFGTKIEVYNASQGRIDSGEEDDGLSEWNLMFNVLREDVYELFADIYVLPTREFDDECNVIYYVTEVGYEFS
jgi:hypothetical protein